MAADAREHAIAFASHVLVLATSGRDPEGLLRKLAQDAQLCLERLGAQPTGKLLDDGDEVTPTEQILLAILAEQKRTRKCLKAVIHDLKSCAGKPPSASPP